MTTDRLLSIYSNTIFFIVVVFFILKLGFIAYHHGTKELEQSSPPATIGTRA